MSDLSPEARLLLEASRTQEGPPPGDRDRLRQQLFPRLGVPLSPARVVRPSAWAGLFAKACGLLALLGVVGLGALALRPSRPPASPPRSVRHALRTDPPPAASAVAPMVVRRTLSATPAPSVQAAVPVLATRLRDPVRPPAPGPVAAPAAAPAPAASPEDESLLLARAQLARRDRQARQALEQLDRYVSRYPAGELRPVELITRVLALCDLGCLTEARAAATMLLEGWPSSPEAGRVRSSCAGPLLPGAAASPADAP